MILVAIAALSLVVLAAIVAVFGQGLPHLNNEVIALLNEFLTYLNQGAAVFWNYVEPEPIKILLGFSISAWGIYRTYKLIMWVMQKIPMFGVGDD